MSPETAGDSAGHETEAVPAPVVGTRPNRDPHIEARARGEVSKPGGAPSDRPHSRRGGTIEAAGARGDSHSEETRNLGWRACRRNQRSPQGTKSPGAEAAATGGRVRSFRRRIAPHARDHHPV